MNILCMNWYGKIIYSQIWATESDESFEEDLIAFYELEYKLQAIQNFPFKGMDRRRDNIIMKLTEALEDLMERLKEPLIATFHGWLQSHAITDPASWASSRTDPYGEGFMSSYDAEENLEGIIGEYIRYSNGGNAGLNAYNRPNTSSIFNNMLTEALNRPQEFTSLKGLINIIQEGERERLVEELYHDGFENFGENQRGEPFQTEEEAEAYIEEMVESIDVSEHFWGEKQELLSILEGQGQLENFLVELNQYLVFPLWYNYWGAMGIDTTRELAEEAYNNLVNASTIQECKLAIEEAIQTCHQNGSMLEYMGQHGDEDVDPKQIEGTLSGLTEGGFNAK